MSKYRRGDVILLNITGKMRPWLVVSNNIGNLHGEKVNVVYMTTQAKKPLPTHCFVDYGNVVNTTVCVEDICTVAPPYYTKIIEHLPREYMTAVSECMRVQFDVENNI